MGIMTFLYISMALYMFLMVCLILSFVIKFIKNATRKQSPAKIHQPTSNELSRHLNNIRDILCR